MPRVTTQKAGAESPASVTTQQAQQPRRRATRKAEDKKRSVATIRNNEPLHATNVRLGQLPARTQPATGPANFDVPRIEPVEGQNAMKLAEELAFMEEHVEVTVHTTSDRNADPFPFVAVNGRKQYFQRGLVQKVRRKYVERLARARTNTVMQEYYVDANGNNAIRNVPVGSLTYPFSVVADPNPRGRAWLEKILQEAG